jgi:hypothetical protein
MTSLPTTEQAGFPLPGLPIGRLIPSPAGAGAVALAHLKNRLLRETLAAGPDEPLASILRLAASEAEAQAWLTSFPLLPFPVLFEEKEREVRNYFARQERRRSKPG